MGSLNPKAPEFKHQQGLRSLINVPVPPNFQYCVDYYQKSGTGQPYGGQQKSVLKKSPTVTFVPAKPKKNHVSPTLLSSMKSLLKHTLYNHDKPQPEKCIKKAIISTGTHIPMPES